MFSRFKINPFLAACLLMAWGVTAMAQSGAAVGEVSRLEGQAIAIRASDVELALGSDVFQSDVLQTRSGAYLEVSLTDGSVISLDEDSRLELSEYVVNPDPGSLLKLARGRLRSRVSTTFSNRRDSFKVQTREGTMGVQGTEFDVYARPRETLVYVYEGQLSATSRDPRFPETTVLGAGEWVRIRLGEPIAAPERFIVPAGLGLNPESGGIHCLLSPYCSLLDEPTVVAPEPPHGLGPPLPREPNPPTRK